MTIFDEWSEDADGRAVALQNRSGLSLSARAIARWALNLHDGDGVHEIPDCAYALWIQARRQIGRTDERPQLLSSSHPISRRIEALKKDFKLVDYIPYTVGLRYSERNVRMRFGDVLIHALPDIGCTNGGTFERTPEKWNLGEHYDLIEVIRERDRGLVDRYEVAIITGVCGLLDATHLRYYDGAGADEFRLEKLPGEWEERSQKTAREACTIAAGDKPRPCERCSICMKIASIPWYRRMWHFW